MFSIGVAKLCLQIFVGFGAAIVAQSDAGDLCSFVHQLFEADSNYVNCDGRVG